MKNKPKKNSKNNASEICDNDSATKNVFDEDELMNCLEVLNLRYEDVSESKLKKIIKECQSKSRCDHRKTRTSTLATITACSKLLNVMKTNFTSFSKSRNFESAEPELLNKNAIKRKARKQRKNEQERQRYKEELRKKFEKAQKNYRKAEAFEEKVQKMSETAEKRQARLQREANITNCQKKIEYAKRQRQRYERRYNRLMSLVKRIKDKAQRRVAQVQERLNNLNYSSGESDDESVCDSIYDLFGGFEDYKVFVLYDVEVYSSSDDDAEKQKKKKGPYNILRGGLKERESMLKYRDIPDEYDAMNGFLRYEMDQRDFRNNGLNKIYEQLATTNKSFLAICQKQQTKIFIDWFFDELNKVVIKKVKLSELWWLLDGLVVRLSFTQSLARPIESGGFVTLVHAFKRIKGFLHIDKQYFYITFNLKEAEENDLILQKNKEFDVYVENSMFTCTSALRAIDLAVNFECESVLFPRAKVISFCRNESEIKSMEYVNPKFNATQKAAIYEIVRGRPQFPFVLFGPPGTGKTTVMVESIYHILNENQDARILVCAPSGRAADVVAERILAEKIIDPQYIFRLNSLYTNVKERSRKLDHISRLVNPKAAEEDMKDDDFSRFFRKGFEIPRLSILKRFRIIVSTLAASSYLVSGRMPRDHFTHIFIDEAGQCTEPESWIPITGLSSCSTRIILCGDPKQLGPISKFKLAVNVGCNISMLQRLSELPSYKKNQSLMVVLNNSYRCHPSIISLPSALFYEGKLKAVMKDRSKEIYHQLAKKWAGLPIANFPIIFHSVSKKAYEQQDSSSSYFNLAEINRVVTYVRVIMEDGIVDEKDIGIISPYRKQTEKLRDKLKRYKGITIDSVERFQGSEKRVIIITTTRTNAIGFLNSDQRFNTAITRAQQLLIVVGNERILRRSSSWAKFIKNCRGRGGYLKD